MGLSPLILDLKLLPLAPCVEQLLLHGEQAVKAGETKRWTSGGIQLEERDQLKRELAHGDEAIIGAALIEVGEPVAEFAGVAIPADSRRSAPEPRGIGTEEI